MLLDVSHLTVAYGAQAPAVNNVNVKLDNGEILAVVGESGSGKSTLLRTIIGLLPENGRIAGGSILLSDLDLTRLTPRSWQKIRGSRIGYIFQDAGAALNPARKIGSQFVESIRRHRTVSRGEARVIALDIMKKLNLNDGARMLRAYPSQLSGGMKQRVSIAMAMALKPELIIADEPTSALDTVSQAQIVGELLYLRKTFGTAIIMVTHNIGVAAHTADKIAIMKNGVLLECARTDEILSHPKSDYTKSLLGDVLQISEGPDLILKKSGNVVFSIENVTKVYKNESNSDKTTALNRLSLEIYQGEFLGIAGESGCGKSTLARLLLGLEKPETGLVKFKETDISHLSRARKRAYIRRVQMVFQEPPSTFSPRMKIGTALEEPLINFRIKRRRELRGPINEALSSMLLPVSHKKRYPGELSGGELQRVSIARCLEIEPEVVIYDEPTSALDATIQKQILDDIVKTHDTHGLTSILISHDIALLRHSCDRIAVLFRGHIVEILAGAAKASEARHPYTRELFGAVYTIDAAKTPRQGLIPDDRDDDKTGLGCVYYSRCRRRREQCRLSMPALNDYGGGNMCACFFADGGYDDLPG